MQKDEELLNATASEPLSLEEEYAMQEEWRVDPRSTFFVAFKIHLHLRYTL